MNRMKKAAEALGISLDEEFLIKFPDRSRAVGSFKLTESGIMCNMGKLGWVKGNPQILERLFTGFYELKKRRGK